MQINISLDSVTAPRLKTDLLVAFNQDTIDRYLSELFRCGIVFDGGQIEFTSNSWGVDLFVVPFSNCPQRRR